MLGNPDGVVSYFMRLILSAIVMGVSELAQLGIIFSGFPELVEGNFNRKALQLGK